MIMCRYQGPLLDDGALEAAVSGGAPAPEFTKLCAWIVSELKLYCHLEENVHATNCPSEAEGFQLEMSGLLSELACPYKVLITGDVTQRLLNKTNCLLLINFLISELEASRMIQVNKPQKAAQEARGSVVFMELKGICVSLGMSKPPANITMFQFFSGIEKKLKEALTKVPLTHVGGPLMKKALGPVHFDKIEAINQALVNEYEVRRKMLLKRLDVTVQSFGWSDKAKKHAEKLANVYPPLRSTLATKSKVSVAHLFAAREDLSKIMRTSSGRMRERTACAINKVLMGRVPDRGGRPTEIEAPPPEMPTWQKRQDGPQGGGRGGEGIKAEEVVTNTTTTIKMVVATRTGVVEGVVGEEVIEEERQCFVVFSIRKNTGALLCLSTYPAMYCYLHPVPAMEGPSARHPMFHGENLHRPTREHYMNTPHCSSFSIDRSTVISLDSQQILPPDTQQFKMPQWSTNPLEPRQREERWR
ncbi:hypothetical protein J4Q44_G00007180 [Coregonus suidteri]|uniref:Family with sequence similarity 98 member A n=1 Tax=Coregonus suidteri TaxID=861788 RepID=A0AAN8MDB7_9TELE